jgi:hypothetical protein
MVVGGLLALTAVGGAGAAALQSAAEARRADVTRVRLVAVRAVAEAKRGGAAEWAPDVFGDAGGALRSALLEERRAEAAVRLVPSFPRVHDHLNRAIRASRSAAEVAARRKAAAAAGAQTAIAAASASVARTTPLPPGLPPAAAGRAARARLLLEQAGLSYRNEDYRPAQVGADEAREWADHVTSEAAAVASRYADDTLLGIWRGWVIDTIAWSRREGRSAIVVSKADHQLILYVGGRVVRRYAVDLSDNWIADKRHAGDGAVPEGRYHVTARKDRGATMYYKALLLNYPNESDRRAFAALRRDGAVARSATIGGLIEIHGEGGRGRDWTRGCIALRNADLDQVFSRVELGTPVTIVGADGARTLDDLLRTVAPESAGGRP